MFTREKTPGHTGITLGTPAAATQGADALIQGHEGHKLIDFTQINLFILKQLKCT